MGGDHPMYIDMHCYPFLERLVLLENSPMKIGWEKLELEKLIPAIKEYVGRFRNHPYMTQHTVAPECMYKFWEHWVTLDAKPQLSLEYLTPIDAVE